MEEEWWFESTSHLYDNRYSKMARLALIDGDILIWLGAYYNKDRHNDVEMLKYLDTFLTEILVATKADEYSGFMQGKDKSHRHKMYADYKANRPETPDWLKKNKLRIHDHLRNWKFQFVDGEETDDAIASAVEVCKKEAGITTIVCSSDKDFNQLEGEIYNFKHKTTSYVDIKDAELNLCRQILSGDSTDNIKGLPGIGPVKASKLLEPRKGEGTTSVYQRALQAYVEAYDSDALGVLEFSHNAIKITLKRDANFKFNRVAVPDHIKLIYAPMESIKDLL